MITQKHEVISLKDVNFHLIMRERSNTEVQIIGFEFKSAIITYCHAVVVSAV